MLCGCAYVVSQNFVREEALLTGRTGTYAQRSNSQGGSTRRCGLLAAITVATCCGCQRARTAQKPLSLGARRDTGGSSRRRR